MRIICILLILASHSNPIYSQRSLKIITYNILNGYDWGKDTARNNKLINWTAQQHPDIVAWQELCNYSEEKLKIDAIKIGHSFSVLLKESGYSVGITSKYPIEIKERILTGMHHGALHCNSAGIDFIVVHFSPGSYLKRKNESDIILSRIENISKSNNQYIVLGDFNSHSPFDADLYKSNFLLNRLRESVSNQGNNGNLNNNQLDYEVMSKLLAHSLIDVTQKFTNGLNERGSFPGRILGPINHESDNDLINRLERIDYILASPEMSKKCRSSVVCNGESNWYLSDHYPVMATFDLN